MEDSNLKTLYNSLRRDNYDVPDNYDSFERTLTNDKEARRTLYNSLRRENYDVPDSYESFDRTLFPATDEAAAASPVTQAGNRETLLNDMVAATKDATAIASGAPHVQVPEYGNAASGNMLGDYVSNGGLQGGTIGALQGVGQQDGGGNASQLEVTNTPPTPAPTTTPTVRPATASKKEEDDDLSEYYDTPVADIWKSKYGDGRLHLAGASIYNGGGLTYATPLDPYIQKAIDAGLTHADRSKMRMEDLVAERQKLMQKYANGVQESPESLQDAVDLNNIEYEITARDLGYKNAREMAANRGHADYALNKYRLNQDDLAFYESQGSGAVNPSNNPLYTFGWEKLVDLINKHQKDGVELSADGYVKALLDDPAIESKFYAYTLNRANVSNQSWDSVIKESIDDFTSSLMRGENKWELAVSQEEVMNKYIDAELGRMEGDYDKEIEAANKRYEKWREGHDFHLGDTSPHQYYERETGDHEMTYYATAKDIVSDTREALHEAMKGGSGGIADPLGFLSSSFSGLFNQMSKLSTWDFGISDVRQSSIALGACKKLLDGKALTKGEQSLLDALALQATVNTYFGKYISTGYKAGQTTAEAIPFIIEMMTGVGETGGVMTKAAAKWAAKIGAKGLERIGAKKIIDGVMRYASRAGTRAFKALEKNVAGRLTKGAIKGAVATAEGIAKSAVKGGAHVMTTGAFRTIADAERRMLGVATGGVNQQTGRFKHTGFQEQKSPMQATAESILAMTGEYGSEYFGDTIEKLTGLVSHFVKRAGGKALDKLHLGKVTRFFQGLKGGDLYRTIQDFRKQVHYNGSFAEYLEEVANNVYNAAFVGDQNFDITDEQGNFSLHEKNSVFNLEDNWDTYVSCKFMSGLFGVANVAGYRTPKYRLRQDLKLIDKQGRALFADDGETWDLVKAAVETGNGAELSKSVKDIITGESVYDEWQRKAIVDYVGTYLRLKGIEQGESITEGSTPSNLDEAFEKGYNGESPETTAQYNEAVAILQQQGLLPEAIDQLVTRDQIQTMLDGDLWSDEQKQATEAYITSKAAMEGMRQSATDEVESRVYSESNGGDGMIHPAVLKGEDEAGVDIVSGNVVTLADGTIDVAGSDPDIVVVDANGERQMVSINDIASVGEVVDPNAVVDAAVQAQQGMAQEEAKGDVSATGVAQYETAPTKNGMAEVSPSSLEVGGRYDVTDEQGVGHQVEVLHDYGNGTLEVRVDGEEDSMPMVKAQLEQMLGVDAAQAPQPGEPPVADTPPGDDMDAGSERYSFDPNADVVAMGEAGFSVNEVRYVVDFLNGKLNERELLNALGFYNTDTLTDEQIKSWVDNVVERASEFITDATDEAAAVQPPTEHHQISGIENEPFDSITPRSGRRVDLYRQQEDNDGVRVTRVVGIRDGKPVSVPTAYFPMPDGYTIDEEYRPDAEVLGVKELREGANGAAATVVVRDDTGIATYDVKLNKVEAMPMLEDGNPDYSQVDASRAHDYIYNESGLDKSEADEYVQAQIDAAEKALSRIDKKPIKMGTDLAKYRAEKQRRQEQLDAAKANIDYWERIKAIEADREAQAAAERKAADAEVIAQAQAEEQARQAAEVAKQQEQAERGAGAVHPAIAEKWNNAPKIEGYDDEVVLANGERVPGTYYLVESGAVTPSHNASREFEKYEGFPVDENGNTINDRDYERDKDAQNITRSIADKYDSRALQTPVIVSKDGVVLSGNGRTMAGELAASNNTDGAYIEHLKNYGRKYGFSPEQVTSMKHPRAVFVPDADMPYTTDTFAKFNAQEMKGQSKTEQAVKLGKVVDDATFNRIVREVAKHDSLSEFFGNDADATGAINDLRRAGALNDMQYASMFDGDKLSKTGREIVENTLLGKIFSSDPDVVRTLSEHGDMRQRVIAALVELGDNVLLGKDYSLEAEIINAIKMVHKARLNGAKQGELLSSTHVQGALSFDVENGKAEDYSKAASYVLGNVLNGANTNDLKRAIALYNESAASHAHGELGLDLFGGGAAGIHLTKENILTDVIKILENGNKKERDKAVEAAIASRKERAGARADEAGPAAGGSAGSASAERSGRSEKETPSLTHDEAISLIAEMEEHAEVAPEIELTIENWDAQFGEDGRVTTPIGEVKMGENQFTKLMRQGREGKLGMIKPTLESPDVIIEDASEAKNGETAERKSSYVFVKAFKKADGSRYYYFTSITVSKDGKEVVVSSQEKSRNRLLRLMTEGKILWRTPKDATTASVEQQGLDYAQPSKTETATKGSGMTPQSTDMSPSGGKVSANDSDLQAKVEKNAENERKSNIQGLESYSEEELRGIVEEHVRSAIADADMDAEITGIRFIGSRTTGTTRADSDLDVLVEYQGTAREDSLFNVLNDEDNRLVIDGITVDINPITPGKSGTIEEFMRRNAGYKKETAVQAQIALAEQQTETSPSEAQKEAGNYKKGHVKIDGFDISIEQPKGSVRSGVDASGKSWRQTMNNTYGYIRGTEGVDGDHIDVFLSDDPSQGDVFVVDQVNNDGSFDEHKVMYGFNSEEDARQAYLSNYEDGWQGLGAITAVSKDEFKKWIGSSHRKTKPFAEYKNVKVEDLNATSVAQHKRMQMEIINQTNPMTDDVHTGIRSESDILTLEEAVEESLKEGERGGWATLSSYPDVPNEVLEEALRSGKIRVYSSDPIEDGVFVTPSRMQAEDYAGGDGSKVYEKEVPIEDVAWINTDEGQLARVRNAGDRGVVQEDAVKYETASRNTGRDIALDDRVSQLEYLLSDNYVANLTGKEFAKSETPLTEKVARFYAENYGGKVEREGFGMVHLDKRGVKDSLSHGLGRNKAAAFVAVPSIIKDGALIDHKENFKGRNQDSYTLAAPVEIGDKGYVGVVIVTRGKGTDRNKFYLHEVILQKNLLSEEFKTGMVTGSKQGENLHEESIKTDTKADSHQGDVAKILKEIVTAKESAEKVANERGSSYRNGNGDVIPFESHAEQLSLFNGGDVAMTSQRTERATERAKRVKEMSDAELLKEMQRDIAEFEKLGRGDWGIQTACTDEYDRRHIKEYNAECERVRTMLDENNVSIEEAEDMLCNAIYSWRDGYATADRSKLLAQFDTLNDYYAEKTDERDNADLYQAVESEQAISEADARNTETPTQQEVAPTTQQTEPAKPKKAAFDPSAIKLRKLKGGETCHVERRYQESGGFDFTGSEKVESDADLAYIFRNLENSAIENTFLVLIKNGKATILHVGMGGYAFSPGHLGAGVLAASQLRPDSVIFVHNHPSGTLQPSQQDIAMQEKVKKMFGADKVREAIIIDITSGKYSIFDSDGLGAKEKQRPTSAENEVPYKTYSFSQQVFAEGFVPGSTFQITDSDKAAEFISGHRLGERDKLSLIVLNRQNRVTGNIFLPWTSLDGVDVNKAAGIIAKFIHQMGGESGILYGSGTISRGTLTPLARAISNYEVRLDDFISVEGMSAYQAGAMEPEVEYEAVPRNTEQQPTEVAENGVDYGEADDSGISDEELAGYDAGRYSFAESITQGLVDLALKNTHDQQLRLNAMRKFGGNLAKLRKIMNKQKAYDKGTVDDIVRLARMVMGSGFFKDMSAYEVKRLLAAIKKGVGAEDLTPIANNVVDMLVQHQLRESKAMLHKLMQVRGRKVDSRGVEVQAGLDIDGQRMMSALKDGMSLGEDGLSTRINDCEDRLGSDDEVIRKNAMSEYQGLMLAKEYHDNILSGEEEEIVLKDEKRQEEEKIYDFRREIVLRQEEKRQEQEKIYDFRREPVLDDDGNAIMNRDGSVRTVERKTLKPEFIKGAMTDENKQERRRVESTIAAIEKAIRENRMECRRVESTIAAIEKAIRDNRMERVTAYSDFMSDVAGDVRASRERAAEWRAEQQQRVDEIHHNANSDLEGVPVQSQVKLPEGGLLAFNSNNDIVRLLFQPLATFEKMLRFFGRKAHNGEGYLFNRFMRGWVDCSDKEWRSKRAAHEELDAKVNELFGKKAKRWSDLYKVERNKKHPGIPVEYWDNGERVQETMSQGEALSLVVWSKQKDAEAGLRRMGISEEDIETIKNNLDPKFLQLAEWVVEEFLPKRREYYNEVHERMFGAPMAAIEHYFPIERQKRDLTRTDDITERDQGNANASTITGNIIKRQRTAATLDVHTDFFDHLLKHLDNMENWAAWAEFNRDINTLRHYKRFELRVLNMSSLEYGAGNDLWKAFDDACAIVAGRYTPSTKRGSGDNLAVNIAKGVTGAKIAFRFYTAAKQLLSLPAFWNGDAGLKELAKWENPAGAIIAWNWAMKNLPGFSKRWQSRQVGDVRLMDTDSDYAFWRNNMVRALSRGGMWANALVDGMTVAMGARAVYETKKKRYLRNGYSEEQAEKRAMQDAAINYNSSQQSSENAFLSSLQLDRTWWSTQMTVFRSASMGYQRRLTTGLRNLKNRMKKGYKAESIEFMKKQMVRDGIDEATAEKAARRTYRWGGIRSMADVFVFGLVLPFFWNLGPYALYLLMGDDDDEKKDMLEDAAWHTIAGPVEGLTGGQAMSEIWSTYAGYLRSDGDKSLLNALRYHDYLSMPLVSDLQQIFNEAGTDSMAAWTDAFNLLVQAGIGVNPETFTDAWVAIADACDGDPQTTKEFALCFMRVMQVPQTQVDKLFIDELGMTARDAQKLNAMEMADRYARYKKFRNAPLLNWSYSADESQKIAEKYRNRFLDNMQERMERLDDEQLEWNFANPNDSERRKAAGKAYAKGKGVKDTADQKPAKNWNPETRRSQLKYQRLRDWTDLAEDVLLDTAIEQAKNRGDDEKLKALRDAKKELTEIKRGVHTETWDIDGLGDGSAEDDKAIMEKLRARRKELLRELGVR